MRKSDSPEKTGPTNIFFNNLSQFKKQGLISTKGKQIKIEDETGLLRVE